MELTGTLADADWESHRPAVFGAAYRILGAVAEAEEVTQEVWLRAAAADLLDLPLRVFTPAPYVTCLDLGGAGGLFTRGWDRRVMASGSDGASVKQQINRYIRPPVDDASEILAAGDVYTELPFYPLPEEAVPAA